MNIILYKLGIYIYDILIRFASPFNSKAKLLLNGRKRTLAELKNTKPCKDKLYWFHVASLGEFEQGRPLIEKLKADKPEIKILLTFFSPSGYEMRKNYELADYVLYLPADTKRNAVKLIHSFKPSAAIFIKYEFWYYYLHELYVSNIPTYLIAAKFLPNQVFFKSWGGFFRKMLNFFTHIYVQDEASYQLIELLTKAKVYKSGDTRFDRVAQIAQSAKKLDIIENFCCDKPTMVCGSTWPADEEKLFAFINEYRGTYKWIIAPHEIGEGHIKSIESKCKKSYILYSKILSDGITDISSYDVLIIDIIGILSSVYRYANIAYIGGGFGVGIHNTLEAAVYGLPIVFGPNYKRFNEAAELIDSGAAKSIGSKEELNLLLDSLVNNESLIKDMGSKAAEYVKSNLGATDLISKQIYSNK